MKRLIALTLAAALALTSTTATAQTYDRQDQIGALLFGLAALAIIGKALEDRDDDKSRQNTGGQWSNNGHGNGQGGGIGIPQNRRVLPAQCFVRLETRQGQARIFGKRCLQRNYRYADRLPARCERSFRTDRGVRHGYQPRCLRDFGFTMARS